MSTATAPRLMTHAEFIALPDDGMERNLIRGVVLEKPMTRRNRFHSKTEATIACYLRNWVMTLPEPRGDILSGEAGVYLARDPDTTVGIDVAYVSAETVAAQTDETTMLDGVPVLAVEIQSPNDTVEETKAKVKEYLAAGVKQVWIVDPDFRFVRVHRPGHEPEFFTVDDELTAEPDLPGFRVPVAQLFE